MGVHEFPNMNHPPTSHPISYTQWSIIQPLKRILQANITAEHTCKNPQQNFSQQNSATHRKAHTP